MTIVVSGMLATLKALFIAQITVVGNSASLFTPIAAFFYIEEIVNVVPSFTRKMSGCQDSALRVVSEN